MVNIYNPNSSSHPTHHRATRRGETPGWRKATCVCLPARAPQRAGGPGAWSRGESDQAGARSTRPMEKPIHRWERPSLMEEPLTNRRDADFDKRGAVKRRRVHTKPSMLATRPKLGNGNLQELNDEAKATRPPLCFCLALDRSGPSQPAADGASAQFPSPSFVSAHRRPLAPP